MQYRPGLEIIGDGEKVVKDKGNDMTWYDSETYSQMSLKLFIVISMFILTSFECCKVLEYFSMIRCLTFMLMMLVVQEVVKL